MMHPTSFQFATTRNKQLAVALFVLLSFNIAACSLLPLDILEEDNVYDENTNLILALGYQTLRPGASAAATSTQVPTYLYVTNFTASSVSEYSIDRTSGNLTSGGTTSATGLPRGIGTSYSGKFVYPAVHPGENYVYVANDTGGSIHWYSVDSSTGALTTGGSVTPGSQPYDIAIHPDGTYLYAPLFAGSAVAMYSIDATTGALTSLGTAGGGSQLTTVAIDPTGAYLYTTSASSGSVLSYSIAGDGTLTQTATTAAGTSPLSVAVDDSGRYVYVVDNASADVREFAINADGTLSALGTINTGASSSQRIAATTTSVYVVSDGTNTLTEFSIGSGGTLSKVTDYSTGNAPQSLAIGYTLE